MPDNTDRGQVLIGTSGWSYNHWRDVFYPRGLASGAWLAFYAQHFGTVEINASFYRLPSREQFERWASPVPETFVFAVKASRLLTHLKRLLDPQEPLDRLLDASAGLRDRRGPLLFQLPPDFECDLDRLKGLLSCLPEGMRATVEFRHASWLADPVYGLLTAAGVALCLPDSPSTPQDVRLTTDFTYVRFHHGHHGIGYTDAELMTWAERVREWLDSGKDVYAYFNNDPEGYAVRDAKRLRELLP